MRGIFRRGLRLPLVAAFAIASALLALPVTALATENTGGPGDGSSSQGRQTAPRIATQTTTTIQTSDQAGRTTATAAVTVLGEDGLPAAGAVSLTDQGQPVAGAALNANGQARIVATLPAGAHALAVIYAGDPAHLGSASRTEGVQAQASATPNFTVSVAPATLSLVAGQSGTVTASITPLNASALTAPMFVTLSCSGLPDQATCNFTPENVEILPNATAAITSDMVVLTQAASTTASANHAPSSISWALLLPGAFGLGGLAWSFRRRAWLSRFSMLALVALVALVTMLGATGCNPRYNYQHHGPVQNPATPAGTYTVTVTAQSSNGVTAITNSTTLAFTVK